MSRSSTHLGGRGRNRRVSWIGRFSCRRTGAETSCAARLMLWVPAGARAAGGRVCAPAPPKRHKEPWKKKLLAVDGVTLCTTTPRCSCRSRPRLLLLLDGSVLLWDVELAEGADDLRGGRGGGIAEAKEKRKDGIVMSMVPAGSGDRLYSLGYSRMRVLMRASRVSLFCPHALAGWLAMDH
jgi:hypothetical protein